MIRKHYQQEDDIGDIVLKWVFDTIQYRGKKRLLDSSMWLPCKCSMHIGRSYGSVITQSSAIIFRTIRDIKTIADYGDESVWRLVFGDNSAELLFDNRLLQAFEYANPKFLRLVVERCQSILYEGR